MPQPMLLSLRRLVLLALLVAFAGCGRIAFVSDRFDNFTAYYNTFYNAEKSFTEGVEALEQTEQRIDRRVYISIFDTPGQSTNDQKFQAAIDKSADVLRGHPDSKWVDDALLLIGKSYFYQQNYVGAEQKFGEVIAMASPLEDEARLWLARTLIAAGAHDEAREHLLVSLNREDLSRRWEPSLRLALGELYVKRGDYDSAIEELSSGLADVRDNGYEARAAFLLGQVYETVARFEDAVEAYERVSRAHPRYELSYAALYSAVRVQGLHVDADAALSDLRRMERDDKNYSNRFELAYLRGRIYQSQGYAEDAHALYRDILYNSDASINEIRGLLHYALGELHRDAYLDYQTASAHFDTARTALKPPAPTDGGRRSADLAHAPEAIIDAEEQARTFGSFAGVRSQIAEMDSLLNLGSLSDEEFAAKILEIRQQLAVQLAEEERRAERLQAERSFQNAGSSGTQRNEPTANAATSSGTDGFLYHLDPVRVQEGRMNFISRWGERPLARNWRRIEAIQDVAADADSGRIRTRDQLVDLDPSVGDNPLPPIDYSNVPRDSLSRAAMRARRAVARYELANVLFLSMNKPDSAATWYRTVIEEDADFSVAQRAFYALAEVHSSLGDSVAARKLYEQVLEDYPSSDFAGRVRERLGVRTDVPSDTLALAEEDYDRAYERWRRGSYSQAINRMVEVAASYPRMEVAPRALLAAGRIYLEWSRRDSMDVFGPIPLTVSDSTLERAGLIGISVGRSPAASPSSGQDASLEPDSADASGRPGAAAASPGTGAAAAQEGGVGTGAAGAQDGGVDTGAATAQEDAAGATGGAGTPPDAAVAAAARAGQKRAELVAERDNARREAPPKGRAGAVPLADDQPPTRGDAAEIPPAADSTDADDRIADRTPQDGSRLDAQTTEQQVQDVLTPLDDSLASTQRPEAAATADAATGSADADTGSADAAAATRNAASTTVDTVSVGAGVATDAPDADVVSIADSSATAGDSTVFAGADSAASGLMAAAVEEDDDIYLMTLYAGVKQNYPQTAYADQADRFLKALRDRQGEMKAAADSIMAADAATADSIAALLVGDGGELDAAPPGADSLVLSADTSAAEDPGGAAADTTAAATELAAADADTAAADADTAAPDADTAAAAADTDAAAADQPLADSTDEPVDVEPPTENERAVLVDDFASRPTDHDAASASASDSKVDHDQADADTLQGPQSGIPTGDEAMRAEGGIRQELGGYTLIIGMDTKQATMRALADKYAGKGFRADVIVEQRENETVYRAAIGHFASQREAGIQLQIYLTQIEETVQLAPLSDFE